MSSVVISGDVSGSVTLQAPSAAGTTVLTLPATSGTVVTTATSTGISGSAITTGTVAVAYGGTGANSATAYAVLCGGTTSTGAIQSVASVGTSGQVLTSNGAGALPTWTTISSSPTTAQVLSATAGASVGEVGTYAGLITTSTYSPGTNITGSNIRYSCVNATNYNQTAVVGSNYGSTISGTWKAMGFTDASGYLNFTVFLRVS